MAARADTLLRHLRRLATPTPVDADTDAALLGRFVRERDEAAFAALVRRHGPLVLGVCRRALGDAHQAEDAFQAVWLVLARKAATVRPAERLAGWLHGVARQVARNALRSNARRRRLEAAQESAPPRPTDPLEELGARELLRILDEEVGRLPEAYRLPVLLCGLEGLSQEEAARRLGWTADSVRGRLERGRKRLHQRLTKRGLMPAALAALELSRAWGAAEVPALLSGTTVRAALACTSSLGAAGQGVTVRAAAMAQGVLRGAAGMRLALGTTLLLAVLAVAAIAAHQGLSVHPQQKPPQEGGPVGEQAAQKKPTGKESRPRTDRHGDPLPPGARLRLGTTRFRHVGEVYCLAFTPDGNTLASCGWGTRDVRLWEVATARELPPLRGHGNDVGCVAISRDGRTLASSAYFEKVRVFDLAARKELCSFPVHGNWVALAPDGKTVAFLNSDRDVTVRDVPSGKELCRLGGHRGEPTRFAFSPDGTALATAGEKGEVRLWDAATGKTVHTWVHRGPATSVAFSADGKTVAAGYRHAAVRVWDAATGKELAHLDLPNNHVYAVAFSPDGKLLATGAHQVRLWDTAAWKERARFEDYANVTALAFSADGKTLASGNDCRSVRLWDVAARAELRPLASHQGAVRAVAFAPGGGAVVTGGIDDTVRLWDPATGKELRRLRAYQYGSWSVAVSPDGRRVASAGSSPARVWDAADGEELHVLRGGTLSVAFAPDGKTLVTGGDPGGVRFWDSATGRERAAGSVAEHHPRSFAFSPDGRSLASAGERDAGVHVWDAASGKHLRRLPAPKDGVKVVAWSPDGRTLAVASDGDYRRDPGARDVVLIDAQTGVELRRLRGHADRVYAIAFSPDGRTLASAGGFEDDTVRLWEVDTGGRRLGLGKAQDWVRCLAFSPDGRTLATGAEDSTVLLWDLPGVSRRPGPLDEKQLDALWADLAGSDGGKAYSALWTLAAAPGQAVAFLKQRLRPVAPEDAALAERLVRDLDDNAFKVRAKAERALRALGDVAVPALEKALAGNPTLEARRRVEKLFHELERPDFSRTRQKLRAVEALEYAGTTEARALLAALARGAPEARLTREAGAALGRLTRRDARSGL